MKECTTCSKNDGGLCRMYYLSIYNIVGKNCCHRIDEERRLNVSKQRQAVRGCNKSGI